MIYQLQNDLTQVAGGDQWAAELIRFPDWENTRFTNPELDYSHSAPDPVEFVGNLARLQQMDFPYLDQAELPLMSMRMLMVLLSVSEFTYRLYPARVYDTSVRARLLEDHERTSMQITDPMLYTDKFFLVQLLTWTDVLDRENTVLVQSEFNARGKRIAITGIRANERESLYLNTDQIERLTLTRQEEQLPGMFRIKGLSTRLLCTDRAKQACQTAGLVGLDFWPIPTPLNDGVRPVEGGFRLLQEAELPPLI